MSKIRIYIEPEKIFDFVVISDMDIIHKLKNVLRLEEGQNICIFDGKGKEYIYRIENIGKKNVSIKKEEISQDSPFPDKKIILGFPITTETRIDFILQKCTELGVNEFIPFACERSLKAKSSLKKAERWRRIVVEACRQSEWLWLPSICGILDFKEVIKANHEVKLAGYIGGDKLSNILGKKSRDIFILIGPEGDFSQNELKELKDSGFKFVNLSANLLRVETACMFSVGLINYFLKNESKIFNTGL